VGLDMHSPEEYCCHPLARKRRRLRKRVAYGTVRTHETYENRSVFGVSSDSRRTEGHGLRLCRKTTELPPRRSTKLNEASSMEATMHTYLP
jgi:hypothetical protein